MPTIRSLAVILTLLASACGDDGGASPADGQTEDGRVEIDAPPTTSGCDYSEANDTGNDDVTQTGSPELTGLSLSAAAGRVLCGTVSPDHFDDTDDTVDVDAYALQIPAGPIIVTLSGAGLETLGEAKLGVYSGASFETIEAEEPLVGSHAVVMLDLPAGAYEFSLLSSNGTAITSAIDYKIKISVDTPATRCPKIAGAANYMETPANNDVIQITFAGGTSITETASGADAPQASGVNLLPGFVARISGEIAATGQVGAYKDPDTYSFTTGPGVDSITIRLNWPGAADLDWFLFKGGLPAVARVSNSNSAEDEMLTVSVLPSSTYWIWTGMYEDSTAPMTYDLSICGTTFLAP
ncbi:MAG: hypothetical protein ACKV2T_41645 [Kofleriaceae bacterium]